MEKLGGENWHFGFFENFDIFFAENRWFSKMSLDPEVRLGNPGRGWWRARSWARRWWTTHLPRSPRVVNTLLITGKMSESVCTVANVLYRVSEHHFYFEVLKYFGKMSPNIQAHLGGSRAPRPAEIRIWEVIGLLEDKMVLGGWMQRICHGAHASQMLSY